MHAAHLSSPRDEVCYRWSRFHDVGRVPQLARTYEGTARGLRELPPYKTDASKVLMQTSTLLTPA